MNDSFDQTQYHTIISNDFYRITEQIKPFQILNISPVVQSQSTNHKDITNNHYLRNSSKDSSSQFTNLIDEIKKQSNSNTNQQPYQDTFEMFRRKQRMTIERQQKKYVAESKWINKNQIKCFIQYNHNTYQTICKFHKGFLQFNNGTIKISLQDIIKIKIMYRSFNKYLILTCIHTVNKKQIQQKCLITIQNDIKDDLYQLMTKVIAQKLKSLNIQISKDTQQQKINRFEISGQIHKKSQVFGIWNLRKIVITDIIQSYKDNKCTFQIKNIKQIWSRFQIYENSLVIKIRHGSYKTEIAIPIVNYNVKYSSKNWLSHLYRLLSNSIM